MESKMNQHSHESLYHMQDDFGCHLVIFQKGFLSLCCRLSAAQHGAGLWNSPPRNLPVVHSGLAARQPPAPPPLLSVGFTLVGFTLLSVMQTNRLSHQTENIDLIHDINVYAIPEKCGVTEPQLDELVVLHV